MVRGEEARRCKCVPKSQRFYAIELPSFTGVLLVCALPVLAAHMCLAYTHALCLHTRTCAHARWLALLFPAHTRSLPAH